METHVMYAQRNHHIVINNSMNVKCGSYGVLKLSSGMNVMERYRSYVWLLVTLLLLDIS